jgi:hypothetical protein
MGQNQSLTLQIESSQVRTSPLKLKFKTFPAYTGFRTEINKSKKPHLTPLGNNLELLGKSLLL